MEKIAEKQSNKAEPANAGATSKNKEKKVKQASKDEPVPEYHEETPPGDKKSESLEGIASNPMLTHASSQTTG